MKLVSGLTPFWDFSSMGDFSGEYVGIYVTDLIQAQQFKEAKTGDLFLLGGTYLNKFNFREHFFYTIKFKEQIKLTKGINKGKSFNVYDIYELDDNDLIDIQN